MSQSKLVNVTILTNHIGYPDGKKGRGGAKIDKIFVHHMAGVLTAEQCGRVFKSRQASAHYGIDSKGRVGQYVYEENTAWHCANKSYNQRSIGIELSNDTGAKGGWHVSDKAINKCIDLIVDICKRNNIKKINYTGDLKGNLCMHRWTASTACPGPYLSKKFKYIASEVNKKLGKPSPSPSPSPAPKETLYRVRKSWADAKSQIGAYKSLANAKKAADSKTGYNVYDDKGTLVYSGKKKEVMYRVRKTWADEKSQVGAYKDLANAKKTCDQHPGYSVYDESGKAVYTSKKKEPSKQEAMTAWARMIAKDNSFHYKTWTSDVKTHQCPICKNLPKGKYYGYNCIGLVFAIWHHGAKLKSKCNCGVISNGVAEQMLQMSDAALQAEAKKRVGISDIKVIRNKKGIPKSEWKEGDICMKFSGNTYQHMFYYAGNGKIIDAASASMPVDKQIAERSYTNYSAKIILRYTGK